MGSAKIFLVENGKELAKKTSDLLLRNGYKVPLVSENHDDALGKIRSREFGKSSIDIAVVASSLPKDDKNHQAVFAGPHISEVLKEKHPSIRVIMITTNKAEEGVSRKICGRLHADRDSSKRLLEIIGSSLGR